MEIRIKHDQSGTLKLIADIRVSADNNGAAKEILSRILGSVAEDMEILAQMERELEAMPRTYEVVPPYKTLDLN